MPADLDHTPPLSFHAHQLACLREVERSGTFTEAARRLHVSQPALSQALAELERRAGVPLFERSGRRRVLTEAGREVARFAAEVLGRAEELRAWLADYEAGEAGPLSVGMIDAASLYALPDAIRAFRRAHPGVELRLVVDSSTVLVERLRRFEIDLAFIVGPAPDDLEAREVARETLHIYAPPGDAGPPGDAEWALYPAGSQTRAVIDEGLALMGVLPRVTLESGNPEVLRQMVALGLGWSVLPAAVAEVTPALAASRREAVGERVMLGVRRSRAPHDPRAEAFLGLAMPRREPAEGSSAELAAARNA